MRRLAVLSLHTSPLAQPGTGDGGGMNVYVRELAGALARSGVACDVFTRAWSPDLPPVVEVEPGLRVHHVPAGPLHAVPKESLPTVVDEFTARVLGRCPPGRVRRSRRGGLPYTSVHANYWLSGLSGHVIKHELNLPLVCTFHTLDRVKAESMPEEVEADMPHRRAEAEASIIECSDAVLASCSVEAEQIASLYGGEPGRIRIVPPGVDHAFFGPGHRPQARRALGLPLDGRLLLFVGRIQPLKCADVAVETLAELLDDGERALPPRRGGRPQRAARREVAPGPDRPGRRPRRARPRALRRPPAPRAPVVVLPGRRRLPRAQPLRVLRAGRPRGGGLRDAGRGLGRGRADHAGRSRPHRLPGRRARPGRLRRRRAPGLRRAAGRPSASPPRRCCGPAATPGGPPPATLVELHDELAAGRLVECG